MESITKPAQVLLPPENSILHPVEAYLDRRCAQEPVHLVQYDTGLPVLTVALFQKDKPYAVPAGAAVNLRLSRPDGTCVYDPVLGLSQDRQTVYVQASRQMTAAAGLANAILEILLNGGVVGTASFLLFLEANPVTDEAILSSGEFKSLDDYVSQAETSAASAREAAERAQTLRDSIEMDYEYIEEAKKEAQDNAGAAGESAAQAKAQADRAKECTDAVQADYDYIEKARTDAQASAERAGSSAAEAAASETQAEAAAAAAAQSQEASANSASGAKASETGAAESAAAAKERADAAENSAGRAAERAEQARRSADDAAVKAREAEESAQSVLDMAHTAQSYAVGGTDTRENENVDNAQYYYEQAKRISQGLAGGLLPMGTVRFAELDDQTKEPGYLYNISDAFTTDGTFKEGPDHAYPAGTNVYYTADGFWDCLAGAQVVSVNAQTGAVVLGKEDVGLDLVDNTADREKSVASAAKLTTPRSINGVSFDGTEDITVADGTKLPLAGGTLTGDLAMSGATRQIKYQSAYRTGSPIAFYAGDINGSGVVIGDGGRTIIGGGEAAQSLRGALGGADSDEQLHLANDGVIALHTNCQTVASRHTFTFQTDGRLSGLTNPTAGTDAANKQYVDTKQADIFYRAVTLAVASWNASAKTQTVTVSGVVAAETSQLIIPTPALASRAAYQAAGIQVTAQGTNSLTFTAETVPTAALTVYVVIIPL